ncbi:nucleoside deaminase [Candidatus Dojkabacteria bacterium]|uniref:Nucleoside deaminase n=1 Tax=Candidatus Dojkabacteria bacterium TaxID=2099670 RepID=A0A955L7N1_9BACT|nr:nucleoside deaminase [Candidatus Dojkabacteria bacterium]
MIRYQDEKYMRKCIDLSRQSVKKEGRPFGSLIVIDDDIVVESVNNAGENLTDHAEVLVMRAACRKLGNNDLSMCTLYSNCEPCPMCSFMIREYRIKRVVFALRSPKMGGFSKWQILGDKEICEFDTVFSEPPEVTTGILSREASVVFDEIGWRMYQD